MENRRWNRFMRNAAEHFDTCMYSVIAICKILFSTWIGSAEGALLSVQLHLQPNSCPPKGTLR